MHLHCNIGIVQTCTLVYIHLHSLPSTTTGGETVDWSYAQVELLEKQGIDLRKEMQQRCVLWPALNHHVALNHLHVLLSSCVNCHSI